LLAFRLWRAIIPGMSQPPNQAAAGHFTEQGIARFSAGDVDGAYADFNTAVELDPGCVKAWINRGSIRNQRGDYAGAAADFSVAIALDPQCASAYSNRGAVHLALWEFADALADFNRALALDPTNCKARLMRGYVWYHKRDLAASDADYRAAFTLDPVYTTQFMVGQIAWSLRTNAAALFSDCEHHLRYNPGDFFSLGRRGLARLLLGMDEIAEPDFAEFRRLNPTGVCYLEMLIDEAKRQRLAS
jgi:tetratricopeptide (TPR) repeat protein